MSYLNFTKAKKLQEVFDNQIMLDIGKAYTDTLLDNQ